MHGLPASTTSVPGISYQDPAVSNHPTSTNASPGGSYQPSPIDSHPISTPARSENPNSPLATRFYDILASKYRIYEEIVSTLQKMHETPNTKDFVAYVVKVPNYDPGPVVLFLSKAPSGHFLHYDVLPHAAVPPWPPPALNRLAYDPIQPCPPRVPRSPLSPHNPGILVSTQPLSQVYSTRCLKASRGGGR